MLKRNVPGQGDAAAKQGNAGCHGDQIRFVLSECRPPNNAVFKGCVNLFAMQLPLLLLQPHTPRPHTLNHPPSVRVSCMPHRYNATTLISGRPKQTAAAHALGLGQEQQQQQQQKRTPALSLRCWSISGLCNIQSVYREAACPGAGEGTRTALFPKGQQHWLRSLPQPRHRNMPTARPGKQLCLSAGRGRMTTCLMRQRRAGAARAGAGTTTPLLLLGKQ